MAKRKSKPNGKVKGTKRKKGPRSQPLPGMEQVRSTKLDNICEAIAEERGRMNAARTEEAGLLVSALQEMQKRGVQSFRHATVELARVPGAEKLRVRITKEQGDADDEDLEVTDDHLDAVDAKHDAEDAEAEDA